MTEIAAHLPERLTLEQTVTTLQQLQVALARQAGPAVLLDAGALRECDTSAVSVLLELSRSLQRQGKTLRLQNSPQRLRDLVTLYGVQDLLPL